MADKTKKNLPQLRDQEGMMASNGNVETSGVLISIVTVYIVIDNVKLS